MSVVWDFQFSSQKIFSSICKHVSLIPFLSDEFAWKFRYMYMSLCQRNSFIERTKPWFQVYCLNTMTNESNVLFFIPSNKRNLASCVLLIVFFLSKSEILSSYQYKSLHKTEKAFVLTVFLLPLVLTVFLLQASVFFSNIATNRPNCDWYKSLNKHQKWSYYV